MYKQYYDDFLILGRAKPGRDLRVTIIAFQWSKVVVYKGIFSTTFANFGAKNEAAYTL